MSTSLEFYYIGDDEAYFKALQGEFKKVSRLQVTLKRLFEKEEAKIQSLFIQIYNNKPAVVFIDFSTATPDYLHLARLLVRTPNEKKPLMVGLVDYLSPKQVISESIATGVDLTHIKCAEVFDVVFDVSKIIAPKEAIEHGYANASMKEDVFVIGNLAKVGWIDIEGLHIETSFKLKKNDDLRLSHAWNNSKLVPSKVVVVSSTDTKNLFYHFKQSADVKFQYLDEFVPVQGMDTREIKERQDERVGQIKVHRNNLKHWIADNIDRSQEKKGKVMVVDSELKFYQDQIRSDKHNFTIRCLPELMNTEEELARLQPQVIAFNTDNKTNTSETLIKLVNILKSKFAALNPFIVVFNSEFDSKRMQEILGYEHVMSTSNELTVELLVRMATTFDKKLEAARSKTRDPKHDNRVFISKSNPASLCEIQMDVQVVKLSETDMVIKTDHPFAEGSNVHFTRPVDMWVNLRAHKNAGEFYGLIHCLSESDKQELRHFVNTVFFREHDAAHDAEVGEFKKLNEEKQKAKEAEEAAKASAEAKKPEEPPQSA